MTIDLPISSTLDAAETGSREARLGSVTGYCGTLRGLAEQSGCDGPRDRDRCYSQASLCNSACALGLTSFITDAAIVHHGPAGCAVTAMSVANSKDQLASRVGLDNSRSGYVCTDMDESDTVFGATDSLRDVVLETYRRYQPSAVFVGASCVSGVIGEDLDGIAREVADELGIPVAPIHCEGFKTKIWASGFDAAFHAILTHIVRPPERKRPVVNVINFFGGARAELTELFAELGVEPLFLISNTTVEQLSQLAESVATVTICGTLGSYLGTGLQEKYGVPYVRSLQPHGIAGYSSWLRGLGEVLGKQAEVEAILERERDRYLPKIEEVAARLKGLRAVVGMGPGFGFNTLRVLDESGIEVVHQAAWHYDKQYDDGQAPTAFGHLVNHAPADVPFSVSDLQNHEIINILADVRPDVYFSRHVGSTVWAMKLGIPALCIVDEYHILGYRGLLNFAYSVLDVVTNRSFTDNLSRRVKLPYTDWWLSRRRDHFLTEETADA
jgi:nitrogenase molybdenum-iron protein alpha chain